MNTAGELVTSKPDLRAALSEATGLELARGGVGRSLDAMIRKRCIQLRCDEREYALRARDPSSEEFETLANAATVVYTWFFRDRGQMAAIEQALIERAASAKGPVRVWVPGCATGEDCISIALLAERLGIEVRVLGTDINTAALSVAHRGRYAKASLREVEADLRRHFHELPDGGFGVHLKDPKAVHFERHNLMAPVPQECADERWDLILCRNVLIYFRPECAREVFKRMARSLCDGGYLTLGASEVVYDVPEQLEAVYRAGRLVLRKTSSPALAHTLGVGVERPSWRPPIRPSVAPVSVHHEICDLVPLAEELQVAEAGPPSGLLAHGHASLERGDLQAAQQSYSSAVESSPTNALARMYLGVTNYLCGNVEIAAHELRAALFLDGELWQAAFYLALAYDSLGLAEDAQREYRHVARLAQREGFARAPHHPLLVAWHRDVLALTQRRLTEGGGRWRA